MSEPTNQSKQFTPLEVWAKSLVAAAIGGAAAGIMFLHLQPGAVITSWPNVGQIAVTGAVIGVAGYLYEHPIWSQP